MPCEKCICKSHTKNDYINLVRHCGWGVPDLEHALWSAANSVTLIVEDQVHPYKKDGSTIKTRDMNFHELPWPKDELEALGATKVQMRVTLSYFIEPNPSARGSASKYHYPSHRLRFKVRHHRESEENFLARINAAAAWKKTINIPTPKIPTGAWENTSVIRDRCIKMYGKALPPNWPVEVILRFIRRWAGGALARNWSVITFQRITP